MKKVPVILASFVAVIAVPAVVLGAPSAKTDHRQFVVVSRDSQGTITPSDFGPSSAQNQQAAADAPVYRNARMVGRTETALTITHAGAEDLQAMIECTVELPEGKILFAGAFKFADLGHGAVVPVVGGTGAYKGAAGTVVIRSPDPSQTKLTFDLR
ncbi:MAG: hypothetical protein ABR591_16100 [Candidatus Velthaea sp.]